MTRQQSEIAVPADTPPADTPPAELDRLLDAAVHAGRRLVSSRPTDRAGWLELIADRLDAAGHLVPLAERETHLGSDRLKGELKRTTFQLRLFAEVLRDGAFLQATVDHADPAWPMGARPDLRRMLRPVGPVAVYAASNFPFAFSVAGGDTAAAIAAGCPVLLKVNPGHPELSSATGAQVVQALRDAGAPDGIFAVVSGLQTGIALVQDPRIRAASFTGSLRGGRALFDLAVSRPDPIPFFGELGSVNPAFVTPEAAARRADEVAIGFVGSVTLGNGQFCTKPGLLFVPAGSGLEDRISDLASGRSGTPMLSEHIRSGYADALAFLAGRPGVRVLAGAAETAGDPAPTILATTVPELLADANALTAECFGPAALVVSYGSTEELLAGARVLHGQLTATVQSVDGAEEPVVPALLDALAERVGRVVWNGWPTGVSVSYAQQHGGPYPATTTVQTTSVGTAAIDRFLRPVTYQDAPVGVLPPALQEDNPWRLPRRVDGVQRLQA
ncbi:MAG: aldehyde dehydrogenase (NADP(+)) [Propionibacteriaceae bacterium]